MKNICLKSSRVPQKPLFRTERSIRPYTFYKKDETQAPRLKCFHNGMILIVNCFRFTQIYDNNVRLQNFFIYLHCCPVKVPDDYYKV